jgi:UbiD family decarboxylase
VGIYRIQIKRDNRIGMNAHPPSHAGVAHAKAKMRGNDLPVAIAIGGDPTLYLASQAPRNYAKDEIALAASTALPIGDFSER